MVRAPKPEHQVGEDLGRRAGIKQSVNVNSAHISRTDVSIVLERKSVGGAGIVCLLFSERGCRYDGVLTRRHTCQGKKQSGGTPILKTHLPSGAELPRHFRLSVMISGGRTPACGFPCTRFGRSWTSGV